MKTLFIALLLLTAVSSSASAANLINEDTKPYQVTLQCDGIINHTDVRARTVHEDVFKTGCVISVGKAKHARSMSVTRDGNVIIRKGKLIQS